jgi:type VI secretion system protein ImpM
MNPIGDVATIPGWYGKLPSLGDFASRRLKADFIETWDLWLGKRLQAQRDAMGDGWVDAYLQSPPWRFLLMPGVLPGSDGELVVAGVLMPSVDRVGRYFPLTIAATLPGLPTTGAEYEALLAWLDRIEDTALDALQDDWTIEQLENALARLAPPAVASEAPADRLAALRAALAEALNGTGSFVAMEGYASRAELASLFAGMAVPTAAAGSVAARASSLAGMALWLADHPEQPQLLVSKGLPANDDFIRMFGGFGRQPGIDTVY